MRAIKVLIGAVLCLLATATFAQNSIGGGLQLIQVTTASSSSSITCTGAATFGGGYGATGATISTDGELSADGLLLGSLGITVTGAAASFNTNSNFGFNACNGTSTGTFAAGTGASTQALNFGTGAGAKTVTVGSTNTTAATTIQSGTGDVTATSTDDISITATDDLTLNGGSAGSIITVGGNTDGNVINVATDDTTADTVAVGSAKDTITVDGQNVTVGTFSGTSNVVVQAGSGDVSIKATDDIILLTNSGTGENITVTNTQGTAAGAIALTSTAGGITASVASGKVFAVTGPISESVPLYHDYLLSSTAAIDVGSAAAETTLYTVPAGKSCIITKVVIRSASGTFNQATDPQFSFGFNAGTRSNVIANATYTTPSGTGTYVLLKPDGATSSTESTFGTTGGTFGIKINAAATASTTCVVDVFGYLF